MQAASRGGARAGGLEVPRGCDVVYGDENGPAPPAVLRSADEAFGHSDLMGQLPCVAGCLGRWVVRAVSGRGGNRSCSLHAHCRQPVRAEVLDGDSPGGPGRLPPLSRMKSGSDPYVHSASRQRWG